MCAKFGALGQQVTIIAISHPTINKRILINTECKHGILQNTERHLNDQKKMWLLGTDQAA